MSVAEAEPVETSTRSALGAATSWALRALAWGERQLVALTDDLNPILVKETRQALKSRQFVISFLVVLVACWIVTIGGVAVIGPEIYWGAAGREMLIAYFAVLAFPLCVVVPYSAYRSLAVEKEENTYDLLSITTLASRQIITGKLLSAGAQIVAYFSAVAPCIAFTFLLRGVDAVTVALALAMLVLCSLGLAMASLLVGTLAHARYSQVVFSVALVLGLVLTFWGLMALAYSLLEEGAVLYAEDGFWVSILLLATLYATTFGLLHAAAAARITFASENRSTPLRKWMLVQQGALVACVAAILFYVDQTMPASLPVYVQLVEPLMVLGIAALGYWYVMGALLTSEWPHLSRRVQRSLPNGRVTRVFGSWLNPGPGAGYVFAVANYTFFAGLGFALTMLAGYVSGGGRSRMYDAALYYFPLSWAYLVTFLGVGRMLIGLFRRYTFVPMAAGFLTQLILLLVGVGVPMVAYLMSVDGRYLGSYSLMQVTNPALTLQKLVSDGPGAIDAPTVMLIVGAAALATLLINARSVATELYRQRIPVPIRLIEDDAEERAAAKQAKPQSPWDEPEA
ncbi:MAG: hypothetical protein KF688_19035 [Pirellulales bacterium]|nr:hypothetical protein [Pirellulales bacterium]